MSSTDISAPTEPISMTTPADLDETVSAYDIVLADFYADWCGPCQMMEPTLNQLAADTDAAILKVDVDQFQGVAAEYGVQGIPTLLLFAEGELTNRLVGAQTADALAEEIAAHST